jgi:hypothetical protein
VNYDTRRYRMGSGAKCESSNPGGSSASQERKPLRMRSLLEAADRADKDQVDTDLGGEVIKQRIAKPGQGKSRGYRTIILFRRGSDQYGERAHERGQCNEDVALIQ